MVSEHTIPEFIRQKGRVKNSDYFSILIIRPHQILITNLSCAEIFRMLPETVPWHSNEETTIPSSYLILSNDLIYRRVPLLLPRVVDRHAVPCHYAFPAKLQRHTWWVKS